MKQMQVPLITWTVCCWTRAPAVTPPGLRRGGRALRLCLHGVPPLPAQRLRWKSPGADDAQRVGRRGAHRLGATRNESLRRTRTSGGMRTLRTQTWWSPLLLRQGKASLAEALSASSLSKGDGRAGPTRVLLRTSKHPSAFEPGCLAQAEDYLSAAATVTWVRQLALWGFRASRNRESIFTTTEPAPGRGWDLNQLFKKLLIAPCLAGQHRGCWHPRWAALPPHRPPGASPLEAAI